MSDIGLKQVILKLDQATDDGSKSQAMVTHKSQDTVTALRLEENE